MNNVLKVEKKNNISYMTMNRPDKLNALSTDLNVSLVDALRDAEEDSEIKAIILTGEGRSYCAGGDIGMMGSKGDSATIMASMEAASSLTELILGLDKYVISAVNGYAAGAGFSLALASDFIVADKEAAFISSFSNIGLAPDYGLIKLLSERLPAPIVKEWISSAKTIRAKEAYEKHIINRISNTDLIDEATDFAQFIVDGPPISNKFVKYMINNASAFSHETSIMQENMIQTLLFQSEDVKEGLTAFMDKRSPEFKGK